MQISSRKSLMRKATVARILALDPSARRAEEAALAERFPRLPGFEAAERVLLYASAFPEEIATAPLIDAALARRKTVICPRVDRANRRLRLFQVEDPARDLTRGAMGIPEPRASCRPVEPEEVDWALVPGLAFDGRCYRVGRGAGYYDRLLPTLRPEAPLWALILDAQWVEDLPDEPHDVPVDGVVSSSKIALRAELTEPRASSK